MGGRQTHEARKAFAEVRQLIVVGLAGARCQSLDLGKLGGMLAPELRCYYTMRLVCGREVKER